MAQIGSNEKPVLMTNKKNGGRIGKGSRPRPIKVSRTQYESNWDKIFNKGVKWKDKNIVMVAMLLLTGH